MFFGIYSIIFESAFGLPQHSVSISHFLKKTASFRGCMCVYLLNIFTFFEYILTFAFRYTEAFPVSPKNTHTEKLKFF